MAAELSKIIEKSVEAISKTLNNTLAATATGG